MTQFLDSSSGLAVQEAAQDLRAWQRDHEGLGVALVRYQQRTGSTTRSAPWTSVP
ncbi:hypothetical protein [Streptomyces sp. NPDC058255]|uniref:hypothetical protein n=1 Tax=Streptomyces sp. NPDC058255 TaxID=3346407 RepID=UPI0036E447DD